MVHWVGSGFTFNSMTIVYELHHGLSCLDGLNHKTAYLQSFDTSPSK